jgi:DNA-binding SARP family transcriptional activator
MRIHLCGGLTVEVDGRDVAGAIPGLQGRALLAYLVVNRGRPIRRDELIDVVWQDQLPAAPEASLSSLLTGVRRALGREALSGGRPALTLTLPPDAWIDLEAAREAASAADAALAAGRQAQALAQARAALDLTSRPLLAELGGRWVEQMRAEVGQLRGDQLETATRAGLAAGGPELATAERLARLLIEHEPYRESGYALLMEALAGAGNVAEALRVFADLRVLLRDELGIPPAAALRALHDRLLQDGQTRPPHADAPGALAPAEVPLPSLIVRSERRSFVGRSAERGRLAECWAEVRGGSSGLVLITGEPGIGKTRLAARFAAEARAVGATVVYGRTDEDSVVPYQPLVEALRHLLAYVEPTSVEAALGGQLAELGPLLPEVARAAPGGQVVPADAENRRYALFEAVSALFQYVAQLRPMVLVVEDLHWADKPTLLLLRHLLRNAEGWGMMVLGTYRDVELQASLPLSRLLPDLRREHVLQRISLTGFDELETAELVAVRADKALGAGDARRLREYTAGNPFFIEETLRSVGEDPLPEPAAPAAATVRVPEGVQDIIMRRFERLEPVTLEILTCASVLGRDFSLVALGHLTARAADELLRGLEEALDAGLVVEAPELVGRFSFCHALLRDTIYARPAVSRRELLHLRAGEALEVAREAVDVHAAELALHFFLSRHAGGAERAQRYSVDAAREAARAHAYEEAAGHYERALQALDVMRGADAAVRTEILLSLGAVRWQGGEPGARAAFDQAADLARRRGDAESLLRAALGTAGRFYAPERPDPSHIGLLEEVIAGPASADEAVRARLLATLAQAVAGSEIGRAAELSAEAVRRARSADDDVALVAALLSCHAALLHVRHLEERFEVAEEAVALADRLGLREFATLGRHWHIYDLMERGDVERARARHAELDQLALDLQQPLYRHSALAWQGVFAQLAGRFDETEEVAREGLRLAERAGARDAHAHFAAQLLVARREQGRLAELLPAVERLAGDGSTVLCWPALLPLAHLDAGDSDRAASALAAMAADDFAEIPDGLLWLPAVAWLAEAAAALGDATTSRVLLARLEPYAGRLVQASFAGCWGAVEHVLGLLADAAGSPDAAEGHLRAALRRHEVLEAPQLIARSRRALSGIAARSRR